MLRLTTLPAWFTTMSSSCVIQLTSTRCRNGNDREIGQRNYEPDGTRGNKLRVGASSCCSLQGMAATSRKYSAPLVAVLALGRAPEDPPPDYEPLVVPATAPFVLHDSEDTRRSSTPFPWLGITALRSPVWGVFSSTTCRTRSRGGWWPANGGRRTFSPCAKRTSGPGPRWSRSGRTSARTPCRSRASWALWGVCTRSSRSASCMVILHHNLALNGVSNVVPLRFAIGSGEARIVTMNPPTPGNEGGTGVGIGADPVGLRSLDSLGFEGVSVLKIDVEGFEDDVLADSAETISRSRPAIVIEIMGGHSNETASPGVLARIHRTQERVEAPGYSVEHGAGDDYIALPSAAGDPEESGRRWDRCPRRRNAFRPSARGARTTLPRSHETGCWFSGLAGFGHSPRNGGEDRIGATLSSGEPGAAYRSRCDAARSPRGVPIP